MSELTYSRVDTPEDARSELAARDGALLLAGGTDVVPLMKQGIARPLALVDITGWKEGSYIRSGDDGLRIGALTPLSEIAEDKSVQRDYRALSDACRLAASPQLRNMATLGGNLLQQTRCWYYRGGARCWLKGGDTCFARDGQNELHSIFDTDPSESPCVSAHPSDPAAALVALGSRVVVQGAQGRRELGIEELYILPSDGHRSFVTLEPGAVITEIVLPPVDQGSVSFYLKAMPRATWSFALAGLAVAAVLDSGRVVSARVAMSGVAPIPLRAEAVEHSLSESDLALLDPEALGQMLVAGVRPLSENGYKVRLLKGLLRQALRELGRD